MIQFLNLSPEETERIWSDLIECITEIHLGNGIVISKSDSNWGVNDAGQRTIVNLKWFDKYEACKNGIEYQPDQFTNVASAFKIIRELTK